jgi:penicillin-binding protein activator
MKWNTILVSLFLSFTMVSCSSSFKAQRVDETASDDRALEITDNWVLRDTQKVIDDVMVTMDEHRGFRRYLSELGRTPTIFVGEVKNTTSEAYFPIQEINDELLNKLSASGDFILVDAAARESILAEITYQNDGMVDAQTAKNVGRQTGADLMIFGNVHMRPETRDGRTIKQYSVNLRMTDIERAVEVLRARTSLSKYSEQKKRGW